MNLDERRLRLRASFGSAVMPVPAEANEASQTPSWTHDLVDRFYSGVTRYTTSSFFRAKLDNALKQRAFAPHIYEKSAQATAELRSLDANETKAGASH
jgi:hypothetical protein